MSSAFPKISTELLRELDVDNLLERRLREDAVETRVRRIARAGNLWTHRKLLGKFAAWGGGIALLIAFLIPSRFTSTAQLMPPDPPQGQGLAALVSLTGKVGGNLGSLGSELLGMKTSADLFAGVLLSRTVQEDLINKFDLRKVYRERRWVDARKELTRQTDINIDRKSGILTIQITDREPRRARAMAQEYVAQLNSVVTQLNTSSARRERVFLEERLSEVKMELEAAEKDFSEFSSKNRALDIKEQGKAMVEAAALLEGQLIAAQTELQGLRQIFSDNNVRVRSVQARIYELEHQIRKMGGTTDMEENADSAHSMLYPSIRKLPLLGVTFADLYRRTKVQETVFETLTQQFELAKVQEAKEVPSVKVLDPADAPEKKVFPPRLLISVSGALLALGLGVLWIFLADDWKRLDPQDTGKLLVLEIVRSVKPPLEFAAQRRVTLTESVRKLMARFAGNISSVEPKQ
jgi:uncharacterized protein involved in exopolysaccharide biosynthesis